MGGAAREGSRDLICAVGGCAKPALARGWCNAHYKRWKTFGDPTALSPRVPCEIEGCDRTIQIAKHRSERLLCRYHANREWKKAHPDAIRADNAHYASSHPERVRSYKRRWDQTNLERRADLAAVRRARQRGQFVERVDRRVVFERDGGCCGICGEAVDPYDFHVDHVIPLACDGEHSYANTQLAHPLCNMRKGARIQTNAKRAKARATPNR